MALVGCSQVVDSSPHIDGIIPGERCIVDHRRTGRGGGQGAAAPPNSGSLST